MCVEVKNDVQDIVPQRCCRQHLLSIWNNKFGGRTQSPMPRTFIPCNSGHGAERFDNSRNRVHARSILDGLHGQLLWDIYRAFTQYSSYKSADTHEIPRVFQGRKRESDRSSSNLGYPRTYDASELLANGASARLFCMHARADDLRWNEPLRLGHSGSRSCSSNARGHE